MQPSLFRLPVFSCVGWPVLRGSTSTRGIFGRSKEEKEERKKQIWAEIDKGYFADLHEFRRNRGKRSEAPDQLTSAGESVMFPRVTGRSLSGDPLSLPTPGLVSLVLVSMKGLGMAMCDQYRVPFEREFAGKSSVKVYELSLLDRAVFRVIQSWVQRNLRTRLDLKRQSSFMVSSEGVQQLKADLAIGNSIVGYAYLLDKEGRMRWRAHSSPSERELKALIKCTKQLLEPAKKTASK